MYDQIIEIGYETSSTPVEISIDNIVLNLDIDRVFEKIERLSLTKLQAILENIQQLQIKIQKKILQEI